MSKAKNRVSEEVSVKLACIYSGDVESWSAGSVITVDAQEAERLVTLGAATLVKDEAPAEKADAE